MADRKGKYAGKRTISAASKRSFLLMLALAVAAVIRSIAPLIGNALLSGAAVYFSYFWKQDNPLMAKVIMIAAALLPWLPMLVVSDRRCLLAGLLMLLWILGALLYWLIQKRTSSLPVAVTGLLLAYQQVSKMKLYTYVEAEAFWRLWYVYVAVAVAVLAATGWLLKNGYIVLKEKPKSQRTTACILAALLGFVLPLTMGNNLNYMLDTSEPVTLELTIQEKDMDTGGKDATEYILLLENNGEPLKMAVSRSVYGQYEVGDPLSVMLYEGFFGAPYYIVE